MKKSFLLIGLLLITVHLFAQNNTNNSKIIGQVVSEKEEIVYATIIIKGTTIGATTDDEGQYSIPNLKPGTYTITAQYTGYKSAETTITTQKNQTLEVKFDLEPDVLGLDEIVVTGNRSRTKRKKAATIVNVIDTEIFMSTQSVTLGDGLNYCAGLRMENDCQNCGFSQIRMNGLAGPYSQILINSRPIFSGLAGVYGLELIPTNMIEKVEIIRGGGSALYGSNAIAGTINLILKDPVQNSYEIGVNNSFIGVGVNNSSVTATDYSLNFNASIVGENQNSGFNIYGFHRDRKPFDENGDSYSEISSLNNITLGSKFFHKLGSRAKVSLDFFHINEERRGGNKFNLPHHEADISEAVEHKLTTGALTFEQFYKENDLFSAFVSVQKINRDSYYGASQSLSDYGNTKDITLNIGLQYNAKFKTSDLVVGVENTFSALTDQKLGYRDLKNAVIVNNKIDFISHIGNTPVADQQLNTLGVLSQYDIKINKLKLSLGARFDHYDVRDKQNNNRSKSRNVLSPRVNLLYNFLPKLQARLSYSQGYRAPQIFDEDLHIETSGSRKVIHINDPDLKQETSNSYMASFDYNNSQGSTNFGFLVEGFYTNLNNPFANEFSEPNAEGVVTYKRINAAKGATVRGVNLELTIIPSPEVSLKAGYTFQKSEFEEAGSEGFDVKTFLRTPDNYGFFTLDWDATESWCITGTGTFTGDMFVPYHGPDITDPDTGELRTSETFFDAGLKISKTFQLKNNKLEVSGGIKNIFNAYQSDFDTGVDRDPAYIYGPMSPRTINFGLKFGNLL